MKNTEQPQQAAAIAEHAWRQTPAALRAAARDSAVPQTAEIAAQRALAEAEDEGTDGSVLVAPLALVYERAWDAQKARDGRSLTRFEEEPERIAQLAALLAAGVPLEPAAEIVNIAVSGIRSWIKQADEGSERHQPVAILLKKARALFEAECVRNIRVAGKLPQFWASSMTYLERTYPERWGRRQEGSDSPRVVVQIGVKDSDVSVALTTDSPDSPSTLEQSSIDAMLLPAAPSEKTPAPAATRPSPEASVSSQGTRVQRKVRSSPCSNGRGTLKSVPDCVPTQGLKPYETVSLGEVEKGRIRS